MLLNFPHRFIWLFIGIVMISLLQSGCQPIQPPTALPIALPTALPTKAAPQVTQPEYRPPTETLQESTSPTGEWIATTLYQVAESGTESGDEYHQVFTVTHKSGTPSYTVVDTWSPFGFGYTLPQPIFWSQDDERLYYTSFPYADGCAPLANGADLYRVDLTSGEVTEILPPSSIAVVELSPNEQQVAYQTWSEPTIFIRDLETNQDLQIDIAPYMTIDSSITQDMVGAIVWSPDSTQLAFVIAHKPCIGGWAQATSIYTLDVETLTLTPQLEEDDQLLRPVAWPNDETILLENPTGERFELDIATTKITPAP